MCRTILDRRNVLATAAGMLGLPTTVALAALPLVEFGTPRDLPDVEFDERERKGLKLSTFRGQVVFFHLWATWCGSCRKEFPALIRFDETFRSRGVALLAVSIDRLGWPIIDRLLNELDAIKLPTFLDPVRALPSALQVVGLPTTLVIDRQGREIARLTGETDWDHPDLARFVERTLSR